MLPLRNHKPILASLKASCSGSPVASRGFSLLELLLAVTLVLLLLGALVFNFSNLLRGNQLEEGTTRLETLMRFARAQAANSGRKVQLVFSAESTNAPAASTGEVRATWEPDPLRQPGCYADLGEAHWHVQEINELVHVESVKLLDAASACPPSGNTEAESPDDWSDSSASNPMPPITFYPDGSSDSAEIIVATRNPEENHRLDQRMAVRLVGITGSISRQLMSVDLEYPVLDGPGLERPLPARRDEALPAFGIDPQEPATAAEQKSALADPLRDLSTTSRTAVGETNSVDSIN